MSGIILGIETSCDDTAIALVNSSNEVLSSVISSQVDVHSGYGGVVPELASRAHERVFLDVLFQAFKDAELPPNAASIDAIAVTKGPGLAGSLMVGMAAAKGLSAGWGVPLVGVNHLEGHIFALDIENKEIELPMAVLVVSGGHTMIVVARSRGDYQIVGETADDAAGEAFDKVARFIGLGYPGGPEIERLARDGDPNAVKFPKAVLKDPYDFSFSGPKTAVVKFIQANPKVSLADVAASFQKSVAEVLAERTLMAALHFGCRSLGLSGGVGANEKLRVTMMELGLNAGLHVYLPSKRNCTDNGAMIAVAGRYILETFGPSSLDIDAQPSLRL